MAPEDTTFQTRRSLMKAAGTVGGLSLSSSSVLASNSEEFVEYVHFIKSEQVGDGEPQRTPIYRTMRKDEWDRRKAATKAATKLYKRIKNKWGQRTQIRPFFGAVDDSPIGFGVKVHYNNYIDKNGSKNSPNPSLERVKDELPEEFTVEYNGKKFTSGIKVLESTTEESADCGESVNDMGGELWEDDVPGGVPCTVPTPDDRNLGTFCATFYETDYNAPGLILSGHVAEEIKNEVEQRAEYIGDIFDLTNNNRGVDWAYCRLRSPYSPEYYVADESNNNGDLDFTVDGIVTNNGLMADTDTDATYYTQGRESRRQSGTIGEMGVNDRFGFNGCNDVKSSHDVGKSDSGGPLFRISSGNTGAYIAGVIYAKFTYRPFDNNCGSALSTTAETVEDDAPGFFT